MLKNLKKVAAIVLSFAMAVQFGLADSYYVNAVEEPVEPQQEETTTTTPQEQEEVPTAEEETPQQQEEDAPAAEETNEQSAPETKSVELSYVAEDGTVLHETASRDFNLDYSLKTDSSVMLNFDGYTLKDVIINNSQTVPADQANLSVTSDLVSVKFVYVSVNTKEDKQTSENNEQTKTEEANEDDAEADPETKEELPEYPAFDQSETAGNVVVHATATEGVLPRDSKLVVKRITRKAILNAVEDTVSEKNKEMDSAVALDITIQNKDGVEIQPNGSVNISFENAAVSGDEINVYHVTDDASAVTEVATNTQSFDTNHFSIYVITGENEVPLTTFNFVDANGKSVSTQIVKTGDTLITPTAPDVAGKAFVGWYDGETKFEDFNKALTITETITREITAKYEDALYVYFYNPDGTQIMRTEKVGNHDAQNYSRVSYDVDSTHKLVGWAAKANGTENIADKISVPADQTSVNVYAIIKEGYWISFNSDGGSIIDSQFVLNGDKLVLDKSTTPTKPGYEFNGWYDGSKPVVDGATVTNPMTLKAHWTAAEVNYTINYWQQKVTDDKNATDAQKTYEYVSAETKKATTGTKISATNSKTYKGFKYNANNSSKDVEISGDGTTIINVYYDRVLCTVNFKTRKNNYSQWQTAKTETGLYGANLPEGAWDTSTYAWYQYKDGWNRVSGLCVILTSFDFETAGYANNTGNESSDGIVTTCNFYGKEGKGRYKINYYNEQIDGSFKLVQTVSLSQSGLVIHEKYAGYELYKYSTDENAGTDASYWTRQNDAREGKEVDGTPVNVASKLKTYSLSYYNYNKVTKTEKNIKYTASLKSYANYTPAKPSELPSYYVFGGWYKDKACTTKFDFNTEKMPNANVQIYAKWTAQKINLTYNLNTPDGTSKVVNNDVDAGTIASTVLPSASEIEGYSFVGWYYADGNGNITKDVFNANDAILKDTNVIGKWLYNGKLTVKYVADGVEAPKDNNVYAGGAKATVANGVSKDGKKFLGWQLDGNVYQPGQNFEVNKDLADDKNVITLTAVFGDSETSAILNYHPGNGNGEDQNVAILNNVEVALESTSNLHYSAPGEDYYFAGWATSMEDAQKGNAKYAVGEKVRVNADSSNDLYATWVKKTVIEVTANSDTLPYNGEVQKVEGFKEVTGGYVVTGLTAVAEGKDFGNYDTEITGTARVTKDGVDVTDKVIVNKINGTLTISKREVTLTSQTDSKDYDGTPLTRPNVKVEGNFVDGEVTKVEATGSVTYVSEGDVTNTIVITKGENFKESNYSITKHEGTLSITEVDAEVTVTIKGHEETATYDGNPHSVEGYEITDISNELYKKDYVGFTGKAKAEGTAAGTYQMNLTEAQFSNTNSNFKQVTFVVEDGSLTINRKSIDDQNRITVTKPEDSKYNGEEHKNKPTVTDTKTGKTLVEGTDYTLAYSDDVTNAGTVTVTIKGIGNYSGKTTTNYQITKRDVTLTSGSASRVYNKEALTNGEVTVSGEGFAKNEGATYTVTGSQTEVGESKNTFTYELKSNTTASNYNIEVKFGELKVTAQDGEVVVTITGRSDTVEYDGNEKSVSGYDVSITEGSKYTTDDFTFNGTAEAKGTEAGTYPMNLVAEQFTNMNGNYKNVRFVVNDGSLTITPKSINPDDEKNGITVTNPINSTYDGNEHINGLTVTDSKLNTTLVENTDYTLTYSGDLINVGTVTITIKGIGNYTGEFTKTYQILPREYTVTTNTDSKAYDGTALTAGGTVNNLVDGETVNLTMTGSQTNVGTSDNTYELKFEGTAKAKNYTHGKDSIGTLTVTKKSIVPDGPNTPDEKKTGITVTDPKDSKYDGEEHKNKPKVEDTKTKATLKESKDYELSYSEDVTNAGTVTVTVTGIGNYEGSFEVTYEITKRHVTLTSADDEKVYDGSALTNDTVTVGGDKFAKKEGATYNVTGNQTEVGSSENTFTYELKSNTTDSNYNIEVKFGELKVTPFTDKVTVTIKGHEDTATYDGNPHSVEGYEVTNISNKLYKENDIGFTGEAKAEGTKAGTYQMNLTAQQFSNISQNFTDVEFVVEDGSLTINPKSITPDGPDTPDEKKTGITVTKPSDSKYDGEEHKNKPTVTDTKTGKTLVEGTDYTLAYSDDVTNAGTVTVTVTGIGNYTGEFTKTYQILPREYTVTTNTDSKVYDGTALTAGGTVNNLVDGETVNLTMTGSQTDVGTSDNTYELNWTGSAKESNYTHGKDSIGTLTVTKQSIAPDPEHPETYKEVTITSPSDEVYDGKEHKWIPTVTDKEENELVAKTDYEVTYSTTDFTNVTGTITVTITGIGNYTGKATRTYSITPKTYTVTTESDSKVYDGTALTAGGKVSGIVKGETVDFTITGSQTSVGTSDNTYELNWTGSAKESNYKHGKDSIGTLTVKAKSIVPDGPDTPDEKKTGITVSDPSDSKYDGKEHREVLTVQDTKTNDELVAEKDYSVTYSDDLVNAGTVTITIEGIGNYTGSFTKTYEITKRSVTLTSATASKVYDGSALTNTSITVSGDGFVEGEGASYEVTGTQTEVGNSANAFEYKLNENTLASNYDITKVVGTLTITAAPAPVTPATPSTPSSTTSTTPRTLSAPQVTTPVETVEKETTPKAEPKKEEKVEEEYTPKASPQYYWALINLICAILTVLFGLLLLISKRHKDEDDDEEDDETKQQTNNDDEEKEQEKKRGLFTRVLAVLIAIVSVVFFLVTEDLSLPWTWTDQWTIWMVVIGLVQIVVFFVGRKWKNVDDDEDEEEAQQA